MGRISRAAKTGAKKTAVAAARGTGKLAKKSLRRGYDAGRKRDRRRTA